jgi:hypothetical protein
VAAVYPKPTSCSRSPQLCKPSSKPARPRASRRFINMALLISHRFSTVKMAEQGRHHDLIEQSGHYVEMYELQAANYR